MSLHKCGEMLISSQMKGKHPRGVYMYTLQDRQPFYTRLSGTADTNHQAALDSVQDHQEDAGTLRDQTNYSEVKEERSLLISKMNQ